MKDFGFFLEFCLGGGFDLNGWFCSSGMDVGAGLVLGCEIVEETEVTDTVLKELVEVFGTNVIEDCI